MKKLTAYISAAMTCALPTTALALDGGSTGTIIDGQTFGSCTVGIFSDGAAENAFVNLLSGPPPPLGAAGGNRYTGGSPTREDDITAAELESCGFSEVTNLVQNGAESATGGLSSAYAFDSEMFIRFRATDDSDGNTYDYEFALRGQTNTQSISTRTLVVDPPVEPEPEPDTAAEDIQRPIAQFIEGRAQQIVSSQRGLTRFLTGEGGNFSANATPDAGFLSFGSAPTTNTVWWDLQATWADRDDTDSSFVMGTAGAHLYNSNDFIAGVMLSFDQTMDEQGTTEVEGTGWMIGPYMVARLPSQPLYFEARALVGGSDNEINIGTDSGDFDTTRRLLQARLTGELIGGATAFYPHIDYSHFTDDQDAFTTNDGVLVPDQSITLNQVTLGLDFSRQLPVTNGALMLTGGASAIWSETDGDGVPTGAIAMASDTRGRLDLGIDYAISPASTLAVETFYDGIGASDYEAYGLGLSWIVEF